MVKQAPQRSTGRGRRSLTLLPPAGGPQIVRARGGEVDALLIAMPETATPASLRELPESLRWRDLLARERPRAGSVRTTSLANRRQTLAVLGFLKTDASSFERLALAGRMMKEAAARGPRTIGLATAGFPADSRGRAAAQASLEALLAGALTQAFALPSCREPSAEERHITRVQIPADAPLDLQYAAISAEGTNLARWLTALPPNILDSRGYRTAVSQLARRHGLQMTWLGEQALRRAGANAFLAVAAGNESPVAGIAHLRYRPGRRRVASPDLALIGKGILFDTGGVNLKPHRSMLDMHTDMGGSAVALATLIALAQLRAPVAADAWLAITENRIGPQAYRPQEVVRAANGVTIQVIHTDAEGRMVLADTLALAARTRPRLMLDFATLTGACVYSLTERMSGVFTNRPKLAPFLLEAGRQSGERVWTFPFDADFDSDLESKVADVLQCTTEGKGDHILAARFLSRFVPEDIPWAHVDLSSATRSGGLGHVNTDVTGFGVRYALQLIMKEDILRAVEHLK
ncbi:MAG: leucyl aminopeptidase family protein [Gammaproteobacteria bacterium]|nr:leucyl aminopeptidase family protein [Gammaproteobacteria bacterium]MDE2263281.1 leucyl aminopeptidase family protein [Gammaproteobacteria bacterium]